MAQIGQWSPVTHSDAQHTPVMLDYIINLLRPAFLQHDARGRGAIFVDATLGLGGHSTHLLSQYPDLRLIGIDRDPQALAIARRRLIVWEDRMNLIHSCNDNLSDILAEQNIHEVSAILFDLGVSSLQLDEQQRGFSYSADADLDMRMDPQSSLTAAEVLNTYDYQQLTRVLREYGEERFAGKIAQAIIQQRDQTPLSRSQELVDLLYRVIPAATRRTGGHPAKRTFQALRIEVNSELLALSAAIPQAMDALELGGRAIFMSYQSLEDKIVKKALLDYTSSHTPIDLPVQLPDDQPQFQLVFRGAKQASAKEVQRNPRSASVRVRAVQRISRRTVRRNA